LTWPSVQSSRRLGAVDCGLHAVAAQVKGSNILEGEELGGDNTVELGTRAHHCNTSELQLLIYVCPTFNIKSTVV
jgi:hypothetical protein